MTKIVSPSVNLKRIVGLPVFVFSACILISRMSSFQHGHPLRTYALLGDLLITAPVLYLLAIRKTKISWITVLRVFVLGLILAGWLFSPQAAPIVPFLKTWVMPVIELSIFWYIGRKFYTASRKTTTKPIDFLFHSRALLSEFFGSAKIGNAIAAEFAVFCYAFAPRKTALENVTAYTTYRKNGIRLILGIVLWLFLVESAGTHFIIVHWSSTAAWIITVLSAYTCLQLFAHIRAIKARPVLVSAETLIIRNGLAADVVVPLQLIEHIGHVTKKDRRDGVQLALLKGFEGCNVKVQLREEVEVMRMFGMKKKTATLLFNVDQPEELVEEVRGYLSQTDAKK
jgi:hypothetical protein